MKPKIWCEKCRGHRGIFNCVVAKAKKCKTCKGKGYTADKDLVELDPHQSLPTIPEFQYDRPEDIPLLRRGAINYSKMLANYRKVKL